MSQIPSSDLENMSGKVFITGANGFIGRSLAQRCRSLGADVCGLDFQPNEEWGVIAGDLTQPESWRDILEDIDLVIHCAALVSNTASMDEAWRINVKATADLLSNCEQAGVKRFVQLSSVAAYGFDATTERREDQPFAANG